jgi:ATP-dependent Clp protease ATP-binding subunit ClpC
MSEYMERHSVSRMIGSPPGYIGYEEGGQLSERVRYRPYSIVLLDEIEKAHADIYHLLLQILEDGTLTDSGGRRIDFKNTIIVMTSNVGARERGQSLPTGFSSDTNQQAQWRYAAQYREEQLKKTFRPEFLNRLDAIVYFSSLNEQALQQIGEILINQIRNRLSQKNIQLTVDKKAMEALVQSAVKQGVGARALRQSIVEHVENKLATMLLSGQLAAGHRLMITSSQDGFVYIKENN